MPSLLLVRRVDFAGRRRLGGSAMGIEYWVERAEREKGLARRCEGRRGASFHRHQAQRYLAMALGASAETQANGQPH